MDPLKCIAELRSLAVTISAQIPHAVGECLVSFRGYRLNGACDAAIEEEKSRARVNIRKAIAALHLAEESIELL